MAPAGGCVSVEANPLLRDFAFPPFEAVEAEHVSPGVGALLKELVRVLDLDLDFEWDWVDLGFLVLGGFDSIGFCLYSKGIWLSWPKLVDPLESIVDVAGGLGDRESFEGGKGFGRA